MKRLLLALSLIVAFCGSSRAEEWTPITGKDIDGASLFVDLHSKVRKLDRASITVLTEYQTQHMTSGNFYFSVKGQFEFDCTSLKVRIGPFYEYQDHGGKGLIAHGYDQWSDQWYDISSSDKASFRAVREMACTATPPSKQPKTDDVVATQAPSRDQSASIGRTPEPFEGIWAQTRKECLDEEGPNSRTLIDLGNMIEGKLAPIMDQYENHCLIDRSTSSGASVTIGATCYEFWEDLTARRDARKATIKLSTVQKDRLRIDNKTYVRCER